MEILEFGNKENKKLEQAVNNIIPKDKLNFYYKF